MIRRVFFCGNEADFDDFVCFSLAPDRPNRHPQGRRTSAKSDPKTAPIQGVRVPNTLEQLCFFYTFDVFAHRTFGNSSKSDGTMCVFVFRDVLCGSLAANPRSTEKRWAIIRDYWKCVQKLTKQPVKDQGLQFNKRGGR